MPPRPLVVTADQELLDELVRLAEASAVELEVATDPTAARRHYRPAPLVLVGVDVIESCRRARLPWRPGVVVVSRTGDPTSPWELAQLVGAAHVAVLPAAESWLAERLAEAVRRVGAAGRLVAVIGGRGGAGASVLAGALAVTAVRCGLRTLLVDADPLGGGIDLVLGWEGVTGLRWPALRDAGGDVEPPTLVAALPKQGHLVLLSWDRGELVAVPPEAMAAAVEAGRHGRDLVVVDLPRRLDEAAVLALRAADQALLVVPAELRAAAAAARVAAAVKPHCQSMGIVVRGPAPGRLKPGQLAKSIGLPIVGTMRAEPRLAQFLERGETPAGSGRGPLAALSRRIIRELVPAGGAAA